jgi:hypothetical protein
VTGDDDFDLSKFALPKDDPYLARITFPDGAVVRRAVVPEKVRKRRQQFVRVPWMWIERLANARHIATYRVALHVLYRHWKCGGVPFTLSNTAMVAEGVTRWRKWEALRELEQLGLITVERRARRSPRVTVIL